MLFSKDRWANAREIMPYLQTSAALTFDKCEAALADAEELYLKKVFGTALMERIVSIYEGGKPSAEEKVLLTLAQRAEANLAFYIRFDEFQLRLTDAGFQRQDSDTFRQAFRYQEKNIKQDKRNTGLNALDAAVEFLDVAVAKFPEWRESDFYVKRKQSLVRSASEINDICYIENSQIIFMRLLPELRIAEELALVKVIGQELYNVFKMSMREGWEFINNDNSLMPVEQFRIECSRFVICKAIAELCRTTGSITDRGLYFVGSSPSAEDPDSVSPADRTRSHELAMLYEGRAVRYQVSLESAVSLLMPQYFHGHDSDSVKRDNDGKKTYWL